MRVYAYLRVSTDTQDERNQRTGVDALAERLGLAIDRYYIDSAVSGTVDPGDRQLGKLLRAASADDIVLCSELSRLGRKLFMIIDILNRMMKRGVKLYTVKDGYTLGDNIQSKIMAFAFGLAAEIERDLISQRTKEALQRRRAAGIHIGRPYGCRNKHHKMDKIGAPILRGLERGISKSALARRHKTSAVSINKWLRENGFNNYVGPMPAAFKKSAGGLTADRL